MPTFLLFAACALFRAGPSAVPKDLGVLPPDVAETARLQILLSRTPWQPGSIDGQPGTNTAVAVQAFQKANDLPVTGEADDRTLAALEKSTDDRPLTTRYVVTEEDTSGPFVKLPEGLYEAHMMECMCYDSAWEELAERFQVAPGLLGALNPDHEMGSLAVGEKLVVPDAAPPPLTGTVAKIRIDVDTKTLTALDAAGNVLRQYPTVVGEEFSAYRGPMTVTGVARDPVYNLDPLTWEEIPDDWPKVTIPAGPNSPVGVVWMQLSKDGYGIHGTSHPETIGHTESHGCVRLTNWSASELADHVEPGVTEVEFVGLEQG